MSRKNDDNEEVIEEIVYEVEEDEKKPEKKKSESVLKRKKAKAKDSIERWSGLIFMFLIVIIGLLLWVGGEIGGSPREMQVPVSSSSSNSFDAKKPLRDQQRVILE